MNQKYPGIWLENFVCSGSDHTGTGKIHLLQQFQLKFLMTVILFILLLANISCVFSSSILTKLTEKDLHEVRSHLLRSVTKGKLSLISFLLFIIYIMF